MEITVHNAGTGLTMSQEPTPLEKFLAFTKKIVSVPKAEIDKREKEYQRNRKHKRLLRNS